MNKAIVIYFSAQNHTKDIATKIASTLGADIFEITPSQKYTEDDLSWVDPNSRVSREHNDISLQDIELISTVVQNWKSYDTVLLGYPIWWGVSAWPVDSFVKHADFNGKTVIPFGTSHSSDLGTSDVDLKAKANGGNWLAGHRFSQNASDTDIEAWTSNLFIDK